MSNTPAPYTAGRGNSCGEQKFGSKILSLHRGSKLLATTKRQNRE